MEKLSESELRSRLEALQQARESCEERKIELFKGVNKLKQDLQEGLIGEQRYNEELAKLPKRPEQIISDCNEEIAAITAEISSCNEQLRRLADRKKNDRIVVAAVLAALLLFSIGLPFLTIQLTGFVAKEDVKAYVQEINASFTEPQQYVLNISSTDVIGELRSLALSGKLVGEGKARVYLQKGTARFLVFDTATLQEKGIRSFATITGRAVSDLAGTANESDGKDAEKEAEKEGKKQEKEAEKDEKKEGKKAVEENATSAVNESEASITPQLPEELNFTLNETQVNGTQANETAANETAVNETQPAPEPPLPEAPAAVEKAINVSLAYKPGTVFDSNDDGVELNILAIDFTVEGTNFTWAADEKKLCTRWVVHSIENNTDGVACYGSLECCALVELGPELPSWNDVFNVFVGGYGATYNNTVSSQIIFANYSLEPGNVYSEIYYSSFATLPASFIVLPPLEENVTENATLANVTVIEFSNVCAETCSLAGVAGLNLSEYTLVIEVENATLVLDNATYTLAKAVEIDTKPPVVAILLPKNITYTDTLSANESRTTTPLKLNFTVSEPAAWIGYSLNGNNNVTITANTTITAANGTNTLLLYATDAAGNTGYAVAGFFVNITAAAAVIDTEPPIIEITSPLPNATYNTTAVELNFTVNEPVSVSYFLNFRNRTEAAGNTTLAAEEGRNRLLLLATDAAGNVGSATTTFFVNTSNITIAAAEVNITPLLKSKKAHFKLGEDAELEFEYLNKKELVRVGKWKDEYEAYEDEEDYEEFLETVSAAKKAAVEDAVEKEKAKVKRKEFGEWAAPNETIVAQIFDSEGRKVDIGAEIEELREGRFSIKLQKQRQFRAGLYRLVLNFTKDNLTSVQEQNFTWGVLAINVNKSIYLPNENAFIAMAVLNDKGRMVCDANVTLAITGPQGAATTLTTANGEIKVSPECQVYGVTNLPDYYATYAVKGVGTYVMNLTAATANGIRTILDNFTVQSRVDFDVARTGPTRIYPAVPYNMSFAIRAGRNYNGLITEFVPASFSITPQQGLTVTTIAAENTKALSWDVQLKKGDIISLNYEFDAPDISPEFYLLGALEIGAFREERQWQVASDAIFNMRPNADGTTVSWATTGCTDNTGVEYQCVDDVVTQPTTPDTTDYVSTASNNAVENFQTTSQTDVDTSSTTVDVKLFIYASTNAKSTIQFRVCDAESGGSLDCTVATTVGASSANGWYSSPVETVTCSVWGQADCQATANVMLINLKHVQSGGGPQGATVYAAYINLSYTAVTADTTPPNNSIIIPLQNSNFSGKFLINASINDSSNSMFQVNLTIHNSTGNATSLIPMNVSSGNLSSGYWNVTFDSTTMGDAIYNLSVNATDSAAARNTNISLNVSITIDNTKPNVSIVVPFNLTNTSSTALLINASVNDSLTGVFNATFRLTTSSGSTLTAWLIATLGAANTTQGYWNATFDTSSVADGTYNITINATDYANSQQIINISTIGIDSTKPNATTISPGNMSNLSGTITARAGANDSLTGVFNVTLQFRNSTNQTSREALGLNTGTIFAGEWTASYNTAQLADGVYNATFNATDFAGNSNFTDRHENFTVTIDNTLPNGTIIAPVNSTVINGSFIINASVNDSLSGVLNVTFRLRRPGSDSSDINSTVATGNIGQGYWSSTVNSSNFVNGIYNITLNATDFAGNVLLINSSTITINNSGVLNITLNNVLSINVSQNRTFTVNATISCKGGFCQEVNATLYYNLSSINPDVRLNASAGHVPFHNVTTFVNQSCGYLDIDAVCSLNWTINATGAIGRNYSMSINFTSNNSEVLPNGTRSFGINISSPVVTNTAPIVFNASVALNGSVTLTEAGKAEFTVRFNVTDTDGVADLVNAAAGVNITLNGIKRSNNSGNCETQDNGASTRLYTCIVVFNYFDNSSSIWDMNISAADAAGVVAHNDSSNYGAAGGGGAAHNLTINSLSAFSIVSSSIATTANINTQNVEMTFAINNTGNFDFSFINITPFDLNASFTDIFALEGNFSINATSSTSVGFGKAILNATATNFTALGDQSQNSTLPHKITSGEADKLSNRTLYIYIDVPFGLSTGVTYNVSKPWELFAS